MFLNNNGKLYIEAKDAYNSVGISVFIRELNR